MGATTRTHFLTSFIGRGHELNDLCALAKEHRLVTLVGAGGVGKTRLAYAAFDRLSEGSTESAWTVELSDLTDGGLVGHAVTEAVGAAILTEEFDPVVLAGHIGTQSSLLFIDNCEHLLEECADLVTAILERCPNLRVIVTSRQAFGVLGERIYAVPPLTDNDALDLFTARAIAVAPTWSPTVSDRAAISSVCERLEGVAFAIELAASRMRTTALDVLGTQIDDQLTALVTKTVGSERRSSMEACLRWSYDLCGDDEQKLWGRISVFPGTFTLDSVRGVCETPDMPSDVIEEALAGLVEKSLLDRDPSDRAGRYRMLEVVRQFGAARLLERGEVDVWRRRHRDHYLSMIEQFDVEWFGPRQLDWFHWLRTEQANLRLAFDFSVSDPEEIPAALRMCAILEEYVGSTGGVSEALRWLRLACSQPTEAVAERAEALRVGCFVACTLNAMHIARKMRDDLVLLAEGSGDQRIKACLLYANAIVSAWSGDALAGARVAEEAIGVFRSLGNVGREANLHFLRGLMLGWADRPDEAVECYQRCLDLMSSFGERYWTSYAQWGLGVDLLLSGRRDDAVELEREALKAKADFGDRLGTALTLETLAWAAVEAEQGPLAVVLDAAADAIWTWLGVPLSGVPYLLRRRDESRATMAAMTVPNRDVLADLGRRLPLSEIVEIATGAVPVPSSEGRVELTRRELEIAQFVGSGLGNQAIADHLFISRRTVESHVAQILQKLNLSSRSQVAKALGDFDTD